MIRLQESTLGFTQSNLPDSSECEDSFHFQTDPLKHRTSLISRNSKLAQYSATRTGKPASSVKLQG